MSEVTRVARSESWRRDFIRANGARCHYCNRSGTVDQGPDERPWWIDHKHALARGGPDTEDNLVLACKRCNLAKGVKPYNQFAAFARAALWVPDDWRASEHELDELMDLYAAAQGMTSADPVWRVDYGEGPEPERIVRVEADDHNGQFTAEVLRVGDDLGRTSRSTVNLIAEMHRLLPAMVTEIRMLRAEQNPDRQQQTA